MSEVTLIGLGNMGSALGRAFVEKGHTLTVWNRSPEKATPLVEKGAVLAADAAAAVSASPVVVMCVTDDQAVQHILARSAAALPGKLLVQLTTSTPQEARAGEDWARQHQAEYLQGAITGSPASIGTPSAQILLAGAESTFRSAEPLLRALADNLDYKGPAVGLAPAWDLILIMRYYGMFLSLMHSVQICQAEGIPLEQYSSLLGEQGKSYEQWLVDNIRQDSYQETSAPLELWANGIRHIAQHAQAAGLNADFPLLTSALFEKAMAAGYGREEVSAIYKVLKSDGSI